jgi:IS66 Orf2 like protein
MVISLVVARRVRPIYRAIREDKSEVDGRVAETFGGIRVVRAFRREKWVGHHTPLRKELFAHRRELVLWGSWGLLIALVRQRHRDAGTRAVDRRLMLHATDHATDEILVAVAPADFRRGIDGLARLCQERLRQDPFGGAVLVFRNRKGTAGSPKAGARRRRA